MNHYQELVNAVNNIEFDIYDQTDGVEYFNITLKTNGYVDIIEFLGVQVWNSEDDMRNYDDKGEYEPLEQYLRREINNEISKLSKIKL